MTDTTEALTRRAIDEKLAALRERERALIERDRELYMNGVTATSNAPLRADRRALRLVREQIVAAGLTLPDEPEPSTLVEVQEALAETRADIEKYSRDDLRLRAIEAAERAIKLSPEWKHLAREWIVAAERFGAIEALCSEFRQKNPADVVAALPYSDLPIGTGSEIDTFRVYGWWGGTFTIDLVTGQAIEEGLITRGEVDRARRGKSGS